MIHYALVLCGFILVSLLQYWTLSVWHVWIPWRSNEIKGFDTQQHSSHASFHDDVTKWKHFIVIGHLWGNLLVTGRFPSHRPVMRNFYVFFDLQLNKRLSKQSRRRWIERPSPSLWRHCNGCCNDISRWKPLSLSYKRYFPQTYWHYWGTLC